MCTRVTKGEIILSMKYWYCLLGNITWVAVYLEAYTIKSAVRQDMQPPWSPQLCNVVINELISFFLESFGYGCYIDVFCKLRVICITMSNMYCSLLRLLNCNICLIFFKTKVKLMALFSMLKSLVFFVIGATYDKI